MFKYRDNGMSLMKSLLPTVNKSKADHGWAMLIHRNWAQSTASWQQLAQPIIKWYRRKKNYNNYP